MAAPTLASGQKEYASFLFPSLSFSHFLECLAMHVMQGGRHLTPLHVALRRTGKNMLDVVQLLVDAHVNSGKPHQVRSAIHLFP